MIEICAAAETRRRRRMTGKRLGEIAEAAFVAKASELGFTVAKPWGDSDPHDFITQSGAKLCRVQVKSAHRKGKDGAYSLRAHNHALRAYQAKEIDALVAHCDAGERVVCASGECGEEGAVGETVSGESEEAVEV